MGCDGNRVGGGGGRHLNLDAVASPALLRTPLHIVPSTSVPAPALDSTGASCSQPPPPSLGVHTSLPLSAPHPF
eukprot:scaffold19628_cov93-Isochrysis_galbana.AAC.1